jgi:uncharacterized protein (TIGR01244 family)
MADIRPVTDAFAVAPQLSSSDLAAAAALGYRLVINNRPDAEAPGQPTADEMGAAARSLGLDYVHIPVVGGPSPEQVAAMAEAITRSGVKTLAFCRSGTRSIITWSLGQRAAGADTGRLVACAAEAGYDLSAVLSGS